MPLLTRRRWMALALGLAVLAGVVLYFGERAAKPVSDREQRRTEIDAHFRQGVSALQAGQHVQAAAAFHRVLALAPEMPEAHANMGYALLGLGDYPAARDFFAGAIELRRHQVNAYYGLALALAELGDLEGALGAMRTFVHLSPPEDPHLRKAQDAIAAWKAAAKPAGRTDEKD